MQRLLKRARYVSRNFPAHLHVKAMASIARTVMIVIRGSPSKVHVVGSIKDVVRTPPMIQYIKDAVNRYWREFDEIITFIRSPIVLFMETNDLPSENLPLFVIYTDPTENITRQPYSSHYVLPDDMFFAGLQANKSSHTVVVRNFPDIVWEQTQQWSKDWNKRIRGGVFLGSPTHRLRTYFAIHTRNLTSSGLMNIQLGWSKAAKASGITMASKDPTQTNMMYQAGIAIRGKSASIRDKLYMATGNVIVRLMDIDREPSQFYHDLWEPFVHYYPVWYKVKEKSSLKSNLARWRCFEYEFSRFMNAEEYTSQKYGMAVNVRRIAEVLATKGFVERLLLELVKLYVGMVGESSSTISSNRPLFDVDELTRIHLQAQKEQLLHKNV
eukprot:PhF_6_TR10831/c0_g1_i4/m.17486